MGHQQGSAQLLEERSPAPMEDWVPVSRVTSPQPSRPALQRLSADDVDTATDALSEAYSDVTVLPERGVTNLHMEVFT